MINFTNFDNYNVDVEQQHYIFGTERRDCVIQTYNITITTSSEHDTIIMYSDYSTTAHPRTILREHPNLQELFDSCEQYDIAEYHTDSSDEDPDKLFSASQVSFLLRVPEQQHRELEHARLIHTLTYGL